MTDTDKHDIEKSIVIRSELARVWAAISDTQEFGRWFGAELDGVFAPGEQVTGRIRPTEVDPEVAAQQEPHRGEPLALDVVEVTPPHRLVFRWDAEMGSDEVSTTVAFELEEVDGGVRVTITEDGFDAIPSERRDQARDGNAGGWEAQTRVLAAYISGSA